MYTDNDKIKMKSFVQRLIHNPTLRSEPKIIAEENIINFFSQNIDALKATFSSKDYFPHLNWLDIQNLFYELLVDEIDLDLIPYLNNLIRHNINFQFMNAVLNTQFKEKNYFEDITEILSKAIHRFEIRRNLIAIINIFENNVIDKYMNQAFEKRAYIAREINFVEKLKLPLDMIINLIKTIMLLGLFGFIRSELNNTTFIQKIEAKSLNIIGYQNQKTYFQKAINQYFENANCFTYEIIEKGIYIHLNFTEDKTIPASSRISKIFLIFGKNYKTKVKIDRGADTFEKSWFQAQRKNYKYFGFDIDILDEFYRIAAENYW